MTVWRDRALVLQRYPWSESSLVVHVLTAAHGRAHLLARGAYRMGSRYFAVLDLFDTLELEWSQTAGRELGELRAGDVARRRQHLTGDLARFRAATTVLELVDLAARFGPSDPGLFTLAEGGLETLEHGERSVDVELAAFEIAYLDHLGLSPALGACAHCGRAAPPFAQTRGRAAFSAGAGGRLCARCATQARARGLRVGTLPLRVLEDTRSLAERRWHGDAPPQRIVLVRDLVERFLDYHLESRPRSHRAFLSVPNRNAPPAVRASRPRP